MSSERPRSGRVVALALGLAVLGVSCDLNDPDELQNNSNYAVVRAQFFSSDFSREPVSGVRMIVESDPDAERPYLGPDVVAISGEDGVAEAQVFPGFNPATGEGGEGGEGGAGGGVPTDPLEFPPPLVFADTAVTIMYNGQIRTLIVGGLTVGSGRLYDLGTVFLSDLGLTSD